MRAYVCINLEVGPYARMCDAGKLALEDVLQFINGAPYFASMTAVIVHFADAAEGDMPLPRAHACSSELILPTVHRSYRDFRTAMTNAFVLGSQGFGVA